MKNKRLNTKIPTILHSCNSRKWQKSQHCYENLKQPKIYNSALGNINYSALQGHGLSHAKMGLVRANKISKNAVTSVTEEIQFSLISLTSQIGPNNNLHC